jgi:hypothetical protein
MSSVVITNPSKMKVIEFVRSRSGGSILPRSLVLTSNLWQTVIHKLRFATKSKMCYLVDIVLGPNYLGMAVAK